MFLLGCLNSGLNEYEEQAVGIYKIDDYESLYNSSDTIKPLNLELKKDKTFILTVGNININGKWEADDNGDRTWITFYLNGISSDGDIGSGYINIWNPKDFYYPNLKTLRLKKIK